MRVVLLAFLVVALLPWNISGHQTAACTFEPITYQSDGFTIRGGVFYVADGRPRPLLVYNHATYRQADEWRKAWDGASKAVVCRIARQHGWVVFFAERRGYGGSEGPRFFQSLSTPLPQFGQAVAARLRLEARDVQAGIRRMLTKDYVKPIYAVWGVSGGGIIALHLGAMPLGDLRRVVAASAGITWDFACSSCVYPAVIDSGVAAGLKITVPIMIQTGRADVMRVADWRLYRALGAKERRVSLIEYPHYVHSSFGLDRWRTYLSDVMRFLKWE
jgi:dienelactone hydrolase